MVVTNQIKKSILPVDTYSTGMVEPKKEWNAFIIKRSIVVSLDLKQSFLNSIRKIQIAMLVKVYRLGPFVVTHHRFFICHRPFISLVLGIGNYRYYTTILIMIQVPIQIQTAETPATVWMEEQ